MAMLCQHPLRRRFFQPQPYLEAICCAGRYRSAFVRLLVTFFLRHFLASAGFDETRPVKNLLLCLRFVFLIHGCCSSQAIAAIRVYLVRNMRQKAKRDGKHFSLELGQALKHACVCQVAKSQSLATDCPSCLGGCEKWAVHRSTAVKEQHTNAHLFCKGQSLFVFMATPWTFHSAAVSSSRSQPTEKTAMGRGVKGQKGSWTQGKGGWLQDWAQKGLKAVAFGEAYHCALLRPYPGEHGEVLIKKAGAKRDMDLLTLEGIASRLSPPRIVKRCCARRSGFPCCRLVRDRHTVCCRSRQKTLAAAVCPK